ncbi:hypothetical protein ABZP36_007519 [Zizania latifolia]
MGHDGARPASAAAARYTRKKRGKGNRSSAKLKRCKLDARREQWLSQGPISRSRFYMIFLRLSVFLSRFGAWVVRVCVQRWIIVKSIICLSLGVRQVAVKGGKEPKAGTSLTCTESNAGSLIVASQPPLPPQRVDVRSREDRGVAKQELGSSDLDSPVHSPSSDNSGSSGSAHRKHYLSNGGSLNVSSGSSVWWSSSRSVSEAEDDEAGGPDEENGVLDDWETVADADADTYAIAVDNCHSHQSSGPMAPPQAPNVCAAPANATVRQEPIQKTRAWTPDDIFRPQCLPSISKQASLPANIGNCWMGSAQHDVHSLPLSCPICYEDLDPTDSSFRPCPCGFQLCLFCYNTIYETDGRCPGCRKEYVAVHLSRSCSMGPRY